jgi:hypothetical protein
MNDEKPLEPHTKGYMRKMTDEELIKAMDDYNTPSMIYARHILDMRQRDRSLSQVSKIEKIESDVAEIRQNTLPHWTRTWTFWLVVLSLLLAIAGLLL